MKNYQITCDNHRDDHRKLFMVLRWTFAACLDFFAKKKLHFKSVNYLAANAVAERQRMM